MVAFGDEHAGFSVEYDGRLRAVRLDTWGFWPSHVAQEVAARVRDAFGAAGSPSCFIINASRLVPQRDEGQKALADLLTSVASLNASTIAVIVPNVLMKMQFVRISRAVKLRDLLYFQNSEEADSVVFRIAQKT